MTDSNRRRLLGGMVLSAATALMGEMMMTGAQAATENAPHWTFDSIYGGTYDSSLFAGKAILLVNTASLCGYTPQYTALQQLYDTYKERGLVVLAVPSDDFNQEKPSNDEVKDFCELNFGITLPMATISAVTGPKAAPLYAWVEQATGFAPTWNFDKVLFDRRGAVIGTWRATEEPMGGAIEAAVKAAL
jgi:glutathione peroxidase